MHHDWSPTGLDKRARENDTMNCPQCGNLMRFKKGAFLHTHGKVDPTLCEDQITDQDRIKMAFRTVTICKAQSELESPDLSDKAFMKWCAKMQVNPHLFGRSVWPIEDSDAEESQVVKTIRTSSGGELILQ